MAAGLCLELPPVIPNPTLISSIPMRNNSNYLLPTPVVAPLLSIGYKDLAVQSTYIIGGEGNGNVLFTWLR